MTEFIEKYRLYFKNRDYLISLFLAFVLFAGSLVINFYAGQYATQKASNAVTDVVLSNVRVFDVDMVFIYGPVIFWTLIGLVCLYDPKRTPFIIKSVAIFVVIRSVFITLTHIGPFPTQAYVETGVLERFVSGPGGDLFFSSHTGLPFLMAMVFWHNKKIRFLCLATSLLFGVVVLLGHLHYTIDVLAAFFITFTIYHIASKLFVKDKALFLSGINKSQHQDLISTP